MSGDHLDRRWPAPSNRLFEADDPHDPTKAFHFEAFGDEDSEGVYLNFVDPPRLDGTAKIRDMMWIDPAQCRRFGEALVRFADEFDASRL